MSATLLRPDQIGLYAGEFATVEITWDQREYVMRVERFDTSDDSFEIACDAVKVVLFYNRRKDKYNPQWRIWTRGIIDPEGISALVAALETARRIIVNGLPK